MKTNCVALTLICIVSKLISATPKPDDLREQLNGIAEGFDGRLGYSLHHLKKRERLERLGDEKFPTDSTLKVAIMCAAMEKVERGEIGYYDARPLLKEDRDPGGFFYSYQTGTEVEFKESLHQMIAVSDNTATLMMIRWIGGTEVVNRWLDLHGLKTTRLLYHHPLSEVWKKDEAEMRKIMEPLKQWGMGVTTPNEMRMLMELIADGKAGTAAASDEMHRVLNHQYHDQGIASQIPPWVVVASKSGRSAHSRRFHVLGRNVEKIKRKENRRSEQVARSLASCCNVGPKEICQWRDVKMRATGKVLVVGLSNRSGGMDFMPKKH